MVLGFGSLFDAIQTVWIFIKDNILIWFVRLAELFPFDKEVSLLLISIALVWFYNRRIAKKPFSLLGSSITTIIIFVLLAMV